LTFPVGDERPCHRCIKRGLQDACQDGVRKKAKYLRDAPDEALMPGVGAHYRQMNGSQGPILANMSPSAPSGIPGQAPFFGQGQHGTFNMYPQPPSEGQQQLQSHDGSMVASFNNPKTPISPPYTQPADQNTPPVGLSVIPQTSQPSQQQISSYGALFDPSDPALFNFDLTHLNFGNRYGALEFGMLNHLSSGNLEGQDNIMTPTNQGSGLFSPGLTSSNFSEQSQTISVLPFGTDAVSEWQNSQARLNSIAQLQTPHGTPLASNLDSAMRHDFPGHHAYAVGAGSISSASPASTGQDIPTTYGESVGSSAMYSMTNPQSQQALTGHQRQENQGQQQIPGGNFGQALQPLNLNATGTRKRPRETSEIYEKLKTPYPYTQAFHRLQKVLQSRLHQSKRVRVAKAMSSFRPTLIACMKDLDEQDLVNQERTFQRRLITQKDWLDYTGTPQLVIRRSGEVAAVSKEFCILSGWQEDVLLGKAPNLNVNIEKYAGGTSGASSRGALSTPRIRTQEDVNRPQPVFLAELLDSDSIVQFYEDFAQMAYGDPRGKVDRRCRVMKYRTKVTDDTSLGTMQEENRQMTDNSDERVRKLSRHNSAPFNDRSSQTQHSMQDSERVRLERDSIDCMMCWYMWRDQFDMPAMISMCVSVEPVSHFHP
jgi:hypothetical protein